MTPDALTPTPIPADRLAALSPAKRALFERLRNEHAAPAPKRTTARHDPREPAPLSFGQERLWFLDQLEPGNPFYNVAIATRLSGEMDKQALAASLHAVIERHESLRTVFRSVAGRPEQVICPTARFQMTQDDLSSLALSARTESLARLTDAEAVRPFDLAHGPLMRARLVKLAGDDHVLLLTLHHIICDGWSMAVLRQEVAEEYMARCSGRACELPALKLQFADYAIRQREEARGTNGSLDLAFWREQLADLPGPLSLPFDRPRPAVQSFRGETCRRRLSGSLLDNLRRLAAEENGTMCMVLLAAFQILLAQYARERDICVGMPIAGRTRPEWERLIGFFVNTLVIRGRLDEQLSFREYLSQLRGTMLAAYEHQDLPFSRLVDELVPQRDLSRNPLVQVMFVLQNIPVAARQIDGLAVTDSSFDHAPVANFDLTFNVDEHADRLDLSLVFNTDLFNADSIERMLDAYVTLLTGIVENRECPVFDLPLLPADERQKQLVTWNATKMAFPADRCIHELFVEQARRTPAGIALRFEQQDITYDELDRGSNRLARYLIERGAANDQPIGVCLGRSPEMIVTLLGILKAGAAYLPIDPLYPAARRAAMVEDAQLRFIVSDSEIAKCLPGGSFQTVLLDDDSPDIAQYNDAPLESKADPDHVAYVIYTSGSTGLPKGAEVAHRGLVNHATELARRCDLRPGDSLLQYLSLSFDAAIEEIFPTLVSGATLHLHPAPAELSGRVLLEWSRDQMVNVLHLPVVVWSSLVDELTASGGALGRHLKTVVVGGDSLAVEQVTRWQQAIGETCRLLFAYGVTEATITSTLFDPAESLSATASNCLPIGRPIANTRVYVLDEARRPLPVGVAGELYIGGVGIARGYLRRPELSAERFVPNPFTQNANERLYRTGDMVRYLPDGNLEFLGRIDRQVKVRGYRIEPAEIEAALQLHPRVREAIVVPRGAGEAKRLAAYVGCGAGELPTAEDVRQFLTARLPGHMLPSAIVVLDELPRLSCAKVDVAALPEPAWERKANASQLAAPSTDAERVLATVWAEVLGRAQVGIHDNFFDIGGDSIRSIQVVARAGAAGWRITPKQLFQNQTIAELARVAEAGVAIFAPQEPIVGRAPLLPIQHEFFALATIDPHHHNQAVMLSAARSVTPDVIDQALRTIVRHHDALRSRFVRAADGAWTQTIVAPEDCRILEVIDLSALDVAAQTVAIERAAVETQASLDIEQGPVGRFVYFDLGPDRPARLLAVIHHLVIDAVSWRIVLADLDMLCHQLATGVPAQLPPKTTPGGEWARRINDLAAQDEVRAELDAWLSTGANASPLPCDGDAGENLVADAETVCISLDVATTEKLLGEAQTAYRARSHEMLLAMFAQVVGKYCSGAVRMNLEGHGREDLFADVDLSRTVGWFTALYPVRFDVPANASPGFAVRAIKERCRAISDGGLGYGLLRWLADEATRQKLATIAPPQVCFNYLGQLDHTLPQDAWFTLAAESPGPMVSPRAARGHLWEIIAFVRDGRLQIEWHYSRLAHRLDTVERLAGEFIDALAELVQHSGGEDVQAISPVDFSLAEIDQDDFDALKNLLAD
ncbi:MAG TPA: amino acid adenylation domain-containing protein [Pirellulales bacterium]|jgi:amino acid adenylation domain-containing protein/non-ribosomal peptide synthase protein (TIGR01720 family)